MAFAASPRPHYLEELRTREGWPCPPLARLFHQWHSTCISALITEHRQRGPGVDDSPDCIACCRNQHLPFTQYTFPSCSEQSNQHAKPFHKDRRKRISQSTKPFGLVQPTLPSPCLRMTSEPFLHVVWLYLRVYTVDASALLVSLV
jgi:hypothetical protein